MKNTVTLIAFFITCLIVISCNKDVPVTPPETTHYDSVVRLSKLVYFDEGAAPTDTSSVIAYHYDSLQRVSFIDEVVYDNGIPDVIGISHYYYNGADSLAFKSDHQEVGTPYMNTIYHFYDNSQQLIEDSVISVTNSSNGTYLNQYTYSANQIIAVSKDLASGNITNTDTGYIGANGNITKVISTDIGIGRDVTTNYTYDTHPNPFFQLNTHSTYGPVPGYSFDIFDDYLLKNNVVDQTTNDLLFSGSLYNMIYTYTYNAAGFPETVTNSDDNGQSIYETVVFIYKKI